MTIARPLFSTASIGGLCDAPQCTLHERYQRSSVFPLSNPNPASARSQLAYKRTIPIPERAATVSMKTMGRSPDSTLGTVLALAAPELDAALPEPPPDAAPVPDGALVTVPVPPVPAWLRSPEQLDPPVAAAWVVAAPLKAQADAVLDWAR